MTLRHKLSLAAAALTFGVPVAAGAPDGYQPQLGAAASPDAVDRYVANAMRSAEQPDALARYLRNNPAPVAEPAGASSHPDSLGVRPGIGAPVERIEAEGTSWVTRLLGAGAGGLVVLLAVFAAGAMRERRSLALR
jgi:hypothetical protein